MQIASHSIARVVTCALILILAPAFLARADTMTADEAYRVLGVPKTASDAEIKTAHRTLMKQYHTDRAGEAGRLRSAEVNAARDVLKSARAKVVQPATKSADPAPRPAEAPPHFWAQPPPRKSSTGRTYDFTTAVPGQADMYGFGVNAQLKDFSMLDMLHRRHEYAVFLLQLERFIANRIAPNYHWPFWSFGAHPLHLRAKTLAGMPWTVQVAWGLAEIFAVADAFIGVDVRLVVPATLAGVEILTHRFTREGKANARRMAEALNDSVHGMHTGVGGRGYDAEALKIALLSYDIVAMLAWSNVDRRLGEALYVRRVLKIAKLFPLARAGLLLRAHAHVGSPAGWHENLRREIARHPVSWANVARWIEDVDAAGEIDVADLREKMGISDRPVLARGLAPIALARDWYHVSCEFALAQVPASWRP